MKKYNIEVRLTFLLHSKSFRVLMLQFEYRVYLPLSYILLLLCTVDFLELHFRTLSIRDFLYRCYLYYRAIYIILYALPFAHFRDSRDTHLLTTVVHSCLVHTPSQWCVSISMHIIYRVTIMYHVTALFSSVNNRIAEKCIIGMCLTKTSKI